MEAIQSFTQFLQASITPVALISGVGLLLLTITNRLGRVIDRTRHLINEMDHPETPRKEVKIHEINVLLRRGKFLRSSILFIALSVISSSLIIPLLVIMRAADVDLRFIGNVLFITSISSILLSTIYFFRDVILSLDAIKLEAKHLVGDEEKS